MLVGFTSSVALVFQAAQALGATPAQTASWIWALGLGMGLTSIAFSWRWKQPVLIAWSTPGAALIAASSGVSLADATGAFIVCGALIAMAGYSGLFARLMDRIPASIASAMRPCSPCERETASVAEIRVVAAIAAPQTVT